MSYRGSNTSSQEDSDGNSSVGSQLSMSSNTSSSCGIGVEMKEIIENREDLAEGHVESLLPRRERC